MLMPEVERLHNAILESLEIAWEGEERELPMLSMDSIGDKSLVDELGFTSMQIAVIISQMEWKLGFNPFDRPGVNFTDLRTVNDLCRIFTNAD